MSSASRIEYSEKYADDANEYRYVPSLVEELLCTAQSFVVALRPLTHTRLILAFSSLFRHVILPKELAKTLPKSRLLTESEWRGIGVQQSRGWQHYAIHR
jgi:cyclin-dependent kinase regulatory subunit CKS1